MTQIQLRHDTAANWTSSNPTLAAGEAGVETDTNKFKLGDGSTAWNDLSYAGGSGETIDAYTKAESDAKYVNLTGSQTISGSKYFSNGVTANNNNGFKVDAGNIGSYGSNTRIGLSGIKLGDTSFNTYIQTGGDLKSNRGGVLYDIIDTSNLSKNLPTASTDTLGCVKVDGTTVTITDGVISASGGGGGSVTVDSELSTTSTNPVQNAVITSNINEMDTAIQTNAADIVTIENRLTTDESATLANSTKIETLENTATLQGNTFNGASQLVQLDTDGKLPALDGSALTGISADAPSNMVTTDTNQTITGKKTFNGTLQVIGSSYITAESDSGSLGNVYKKVYNSSSGSYTYSKWLAFDFDNNYQTIFNDSNGFSFIVSNNGLTVTSSSTSTGTKIQDGKIQIGGNDALWKTKTVIDTDQIICLGNTTDGAKLVARAEAPSAQLETYIDGTTSKGYIFASNNISNYIDSDSITWDSTNKKLQVPGISEIETRLTTDETATLTNSTNISNLQDGTGFTSTGKTAIANMAMPSDTYVDLTLGATGTSYTAPADGYVFVFGITTATNNYLNINSSNGIISSCFQTNLGWNTNAFLPVKKGETFTINYNDTLNGAYVKFYYAVGSEPESTDA